MGGSFVHISREDEDEAEDVRPAADTGTNAGRFHAVRRPGAARSMHPQASPCAMHLPREAVGSLGANAPHAHALLACWPHRHLCSGGYKLAAQACRAVCLAPSTFICSRQVISARPPCPVDTMTKRDGTDKVESTAEDVIVDAKDAAKDAADKATQAAKDAADRAAKAVKDTADKAAKAAKDAGDSVDEAADSAAAKARGILSDAKKSGEKLARRALDEANAAEKALEKQAKATSPAVLRTLGVLAAALAAVSGYYFRLPGRDNQRIGFAGG
ncbi:hypothetical protein H4R21_006285, partial [Coemansia helicoidea]